MVENRKVMSGMRIAPRFIIIDYGSGEAVYSLLMGEVIPSSKITFHYFAQPRDRSGW